MNTPLLFDGSLDQAETWLLRFISRLNQEAEIIEVERDGLQGQGLRWLNHFELAPTSEAMGARRFKITNTVQVSGKLHTNTLGVILLTPLPKATKLELATLETRHGRKAIEAFWHKLQGAMRADRVLVETEREEPECVSEPIKPILPDWFPKHDATKRKWKRRYRRDIGPLLERGIKSAAAIEREIRKNDPNGPTRKTIGKIMKWWNLEGAGYKK